MRTYLINLPSSAERRARMTALLEGMGLAFEISEGVDAKAMGARISLEFDHHDRTTATDPEMVCVLSHIRTWERFVASGEPRALILEDDVHFAPSFLRVLADLEVAPDAEALWRLETLLATVTADRQPVQRLANGGVYAIHSNHGGTAAYVLSRAMAQRLLAQRRAFRRAIDIELCDPVRRSIDPVRVLQCIPAPCIQDDILNPGASAPYLASMVGRERADDLLGIRGGDRPLVRTLKSLARPAYRWLASERLRSRGMRRVRVAFG